MISSLKIHRYVIVALIAAIAILSFRACVSRGEKLDQYKEVVQLQHDTIVQYQDVAGNQHAQVAIQQADMEFLKALHAKEIDSILYLLNIKDKQVQGVTMASTSTAATIKPRVDTVFVDSSHTDYNLTYTDKWLKINGKIGSNNFLKYSYKDSLIFTTLVTKNLLRVDAYSLNPNTTITGLTSIKIPIPKEKKWGLGPYMGYGFDGNKMQASAGISLHYSLIRF